METRMNYKLVADSSCDIHGMQGAAFATVPLHIITDAADYVDDETLDVPAMTEQLRRYKGKSSTACPNVADYEVAFGEAEFVFVVTITSALSGSFGAAMCAKDSYEQAHPGRRVHVIDSRSTGPELVLILEKLRACIDAGMDFDAIVAEITAYQEKSRLLFVLSSIQNLARNGRASKIGADAVGLLGIRIYGRASDEGKLDILGKCRGEAAALSHLIRRMDGYRGGKVVIAHCLSQPGAQALKASLLERWPEADIRILTTGGLCSFYAEKGGILVGYET